jgi:hypothetical protein
VDRLVNDLHSMMGQMSEDMKEMKETLAMVTGKENRQPNRKSTKQQGPVNHKSKYFANKAKTGRAEKTPKGSNTSDEVESDDDTQNPEPTIYRVYRATVVYPQSRDEPPSHVRRPFGLCHRPSSFKDSSGMLQLESEPPELVSSDDLPEQELVDSIQPTTSGNGRAPTFADIDNINLLENYLLKPDSQEAFNLSYAPRPTGPGSWWTIRSGVCCHTRTKKLY